MTDQLKQLSEAATQGEWRVALERGCHGIIAASLPEGGANFIALVGNNDGDPEKEKTRFTNAELMAAAVNAYRAGELIPASEARAQVAVAYEVAASEAERYAEHYQQGSDGRNTFIIFADMMRQKASEAAQ